MDDKRLARSCSILNKETENLQSADSQEEVAYILSASQLLCAMISPDHFLQEIPPSKTTISTAITEQLRRSNPALLIQETTPQKEPSTKE